jgi:DNA-binding Lrp family transcriptional regulator
MCGSITLEQLSGRLKLKPHNVRYQLNLLFEAKRILRGFLVNQRALGFQVFNVFFDLPRVKTAKFLEFARARTEVAWLCQNVGPRRFEVTMIHRDYAQVATFLHALGDEVGSSLRKPIFSMEGEVRHWGLRFLAKNESTEPVVAFSMPAELVEIDGLDRKIISLLMSGESCATPHLGSLIGVASSTVKYRIERLKRAGVISNELFFVDSNRDLLQAQVVLNLKARSTENEARVLALCSANPHVEGLISGVGAWDFKIIFQAESMRELVDVQDKLLHQIGAIIDKSETYIRDRILWIASGIPWAGSYDMRAVAAARCDTV